MASLSAWIQLLSTAARGAGIGGNPLLKHLWFAFQRRRAAFDWILQQSCKKVNPRVQPVLWWALTECYALQGLPAPVAVSIATEWTKQHRSQREASFVNGVLRNILRSCPDSAALESRLSSAPPAVRLGLPGALYERWRQSFGPQGVEKLALLCQQPAAVTGRRRGSLATVRCGKVMECCAENFDPAQFYLQDSSTLLAPLLLNPQPGEAIADLCAAPGGKSLIIAERLQGKGQLTCRDRSPERLKQLHENLDGFPNVSIGACDGAAPDLPPASQDGVLLDVPCSNTGVLRRRPDVRWNFTTAGLRELMATQRAILDGAAGIVRPGGRIVYSTCSIEPDENIQQVQAFLQRHPDFTLAVSRQLLPTEFHDGAYAALLIRS